MMLKYTLKFKTKLTPTKSINYRTEKMINKLAFKFNSYGVYTLIYSCNKLFTGEIHKSSI